MFKNILSKIGIKRTFFNSVQNFKSTFNNFTAVEKILSKYPQNKGAVNPLLHLAQEQSGYLSIGAMHEIANLCEVPNVVVYECAHFYAMYNNESVGRFHVNVCVTAPCELSGSEGILEAIENHLNIKLGETTSDNMFSLGEMECMGCCVNAPMIAIADYSNPNDFKYDYYEDLTAANAIRILDTLRKGEKVKPGPQGGRKSSEPKKKKE